MLNHDAEKVLAILTKTWGSVPQEPGAKMWIWKTGFTGTLGGGQLEFEVLSKARALLETSLKTEVAEFVLSQDLKQCCGGKVSVYFEKQVERPKVLCFGAGHVAQQLARVLEGTSVELHIVDARDEWINHLPKETNSHQVEPLEFIKQMPSGFSQFAVVLTHSHELDEKIVDQLASNESFKRVGLIGSDTKWRRFQSRLKLNDISETMLSKVQCPVGTFKGKSKEPRDIAISIAAQILQWVEESS